jgi:FAD/FMN-containing dehydrogenase
MSDDKARVGLQQLQGAVSGSVIGPTAGSYDEDRSIFNAMIDCRPAVIVRCEDEADVRAALAFAAEQELEIAVRGGGHSVAGSGVCNDGMVIDMRRMNAVSVDPEKRVATVQGGAIWAEVDAATQPHGLATTGGRVSTTGVAGLTLGGGSGWLERKFGLACDGLVSVELITAAGEKVRASAEENPELFWALHGGGGNFGVVTSLQLRLHPLPEFSIALLLWPADRGREVLRCYRDLMPDTPPELGGGMLYLTAPPEEFVPESMHGRLAAAVLATYAGTEEELREQIRPLLELEPEGRLITPIPYAELQSMLDDPPGFRNYWSAEHLEELTDEAIELFCARADEIIVPSATQHILFYWDGAVADNAGDYPVRGREARWVVHPLTMWEDPADDERAIEWTRNVRSDMKPWAAAGAYLNFTGDEGEDRVIEGFGGREVYERLGRVKARYDPANAFHLNHNIRPLTPA